MATWIFSAVWINYIVRFLHQSSVWMRFESDRNFMTIGFVVLLILAKMLPKKRWFWIGAWRMNGFLRILWNFFQLWWLLFFYNLETWTFNGSSGSSIPLCVVQFEIFLLTFSSTFNEINWRKWCHNLLTDLNASILFSNKFVFHLLAKYCISHF